MYRVIGKINSFENIPWGKPIIITGSIDGNRAWFQRMPGVFKKDNDNFRFVDDFGMSTCFEKNDFLSLNLLEKQIGAGNYAHKPEKDGEEE
jgi:hypothetical protein